MCICNYKPKDKNDTEFHQVPFLGLCCSTSTSSIGSNSKIKQKQENMLSCYADDTGLFHHVTQFVSSNK